MAFQILLPHINTKKKKFNVILLLIFVLSVYHWIISVRRSFANENYFMNHLKQLLKTFDFVRFSKSYQIF